MSVKTAFSKKSSVQDACIELVNELAVSQPGMILYFASSEYSPQELSKEMEKSFPGSKIFGCTTAGEIVTGKMLKKSVVAMALPSDVVEDVCIQVVENLNKTDQYQDVFKHFEEYYQVPASGFDISKYVGIVLIDGMSGAEEIVMEKISDLTDLTIIGGSAGDDVKFKETFVFANGKAYPNAAILALLKTRNGFDTIKTQSFHTTPIKLVATDVDEAKRKVIAFNGNPAVQAYADALGVPVQDAAKYFMSSPIGLMVGDEPFVRSPQQTQGDSIVFYCNIKPGMELSLLKSTDIVSDTRKAVAENLQDNPTAAAIINFNCILRTLELDMRNSAEAYGQIFQDFPTIGFSTYGEAYVGHINQTAVILVIN
jgi:hypothetical protein